MNPPVFRFAPSPNGLLHIGHAYCALLNAQEADACGGTFLLRIEDIDTVRCKRAFEDAIYEDLSWLGLGWSEPVLRQSERLPFYAAAQDELRAQGLLYPCFCTRGDVLRAVADKPGWPRDSDGAPLYPGTCRTLPAAVRADRLACEPHAWRLDMARAVARTGPLAWDEWSESRTDRIAANPLAWGDVVLARKDIGTSYHVAVVTDDAHQAVTHVVRGRDLFAATAVHRVLQALLGLPVPVYRHHPLLRDASGDKLAKSRRATPLRTLRETGVTPAQVRTSLGFGPA